MTLSCFWPRAESNNYHGKVFVAAFSFSSESDAEQTQLLGRNLSLKKKKMGFREVIN